MGIEWLKLFHHLPEDRKLLSFSISQKWAWVCLLCAASQGGERGAVVDDQDDMAAYCGFPNVQDYQFFLDKLRKKGMIEPISGGFKIHNWEKRQYVQPSDTSEATRERKRKQRAKSKESSEEMSRDVTPMSRDVTPMSRQCHATDKIQIQIKNTEPDPETEQDLDARTRLPYPDRLKEFSQISRPETPTASRTDHGASDDRHPETLASNPDIEITAIPRRICAENPQQAAQPSGLMSAPTVQQLTIPTGILEASSRSDFVAEAIATYNQYRGQWGECRDLPEGYQNRLLQIMHRQSGDKKQRWQAALALVRDATLWVARSEWLNRPEFEGKNIHHLIGRTAGDRMADYASQWRSLPESAMVGAAIKISQQKPEKQYVDLQGEAIRMSAAWSLWWKISKKARNEPEAISKLEKDWAIYYFPRYDIYEGAEELDD